MTCNADPCAYLVASFRTARMGVVHRAHITMLRCFVRTAELDGLGPFGTAAKKRREWGLKR